MLKKVIGMPALILGVIILSVYKLARRNSNIRFTELLTSRIGHYAGDLLSLAADGQKDTYIYLKKPAG
jgi:hypothetical protein